MRVVRHLHREPGRLERVVLTLGNFDGVHLGHQAIISRAVAVARERRGQAVVFTFEPHPLTVLAPARAPALLQPLAERLALLRDLGAAVAVVQRFTPRFARQTPAEFVTDWLLAHLDLGHVVVGHNVSFGKDRAGNTETLRTLGAAHAFSVESIGPVTVDGMEVSSTTLRRALQAGDVALATRLLGRRHRLRGRVTTGERRGRTLGFPTANLHVPPGLLLPADGVYAVLAGVEGEQIPGVLNIGERPTFGERRRTIETHLLDWTGDIYGRPMTLELVARIRGERAFAGVDALRAAITEDVAHARSILDAAGVAR